jgi:glycosyltransferase involved in cell wall biosynthesis
MARADPHREKRVRIAYVTETYPPEVNGVALTVERTVRWLRERGHDLDLIRPRQRTEGPCCDDNEWRTFGLPIPMYPQLRFGVATSGGLRERFERLAPQLVHVATQGPLGYAALSAANALGLPVTTDFRTNFHSYSRYYHLGFCEPVARYYLRAFHNRADRTFVPARALRAQLMAQGFERLEVIGRGVDASAFSPQRRSDALRAQWGVTSARQPVLLYVGRLAAEKNVELALGTYEALRRQRADLRMVVVGDGPLRERLRVRFPDVVYTGMLHGDSLAAHYASADVFLFPSESETFGNVTLEALASGLAVVAYDTAAAGEHIWHDHNGMAVPPGNADAFMNAATRVLAMAQPGSLLRQRARETALAADWGSVLRRFDSRLVRVAFSPAAERAAHVAPA